MRIISGSLKGRRITTVSGSGYRPATDRVREAVFSILQSRGVEWEASRVADLFAGSGSLGIEALSRGASYALFVEMNKKAARTIKENLVQLKVSGQHYRVVMKDVLALLRRPPDEPFDVTFIDPPYGMGLLQKTLNAVMENRWVAPGGIVVAEVEASLAPQDQAGLNLLLDRTYGQTRILLWEKKN